MARFVTLVTDWTIRGVVLVSLCAHVVLALLASIRRREGSGVGTVVLWVAYQVADWATPFVLSNLSLGSTSREQQLVAFWLPFLLAHLGGPDNITAYSLEDNKISLRQVISTLLRFQVISFAIYKQYTAITSKGALFWASAVMVAVGVAKYLERVRALRNGDFGSIRSANKNQPKGLRIQSCGRAEVLGNEKALLLAHELLDITKGAFADDYLGKKAEEQLRSNANLKEIFSVNHNDSGWKNMCKVVDMELSLMYDILYTKAAIVHTVPGYVIRVVSLVITTTVIMLFSLYNKQGQRTADVIVTYILLTITFLLDLRWLLGAAASTWAYAFFNARPTLWLHHEVCCSRRWHRLRRFVMSLDPWQRHLRDGGGGYRLWSRAIGQYNLFDEVTHGGRTSGFISWLFKKISMEDAWTDYKYTRRVLCLDSAKNVNELLFQQIQKAFKMESPPPPSAPAYPKPKPKGERSEPPDKAAGHARRRDLDEELGFLPEFQELILIWHVATEVFLLCSHENHSPDPEEGKYVEAISAVSNYMAFLAAVRCDMLPGLKLRSQHQATREALDRLWKSVTESSSACTSLNCKAVDAKRRLVHILKCWEHAKNPSCLVREEITPYQKRSALYDYSIVLSDGIHFADLLQKLLKSEDWNRTLEREKKKEGSNSWKRFMFLIPDLEKRPKAWDMLQMLKLLLKSWVRMLIYVSIRCSRDSHAKQLGRGCELTTVVWILSEHVGIFAH